MRQTMVGALATIVAGATFAWLGCETVGAQRPPDSGDGRPSQPVELGRVPWLRDFATARTLAASSHKPLLVLFDEVPGCSTVRDFGRRVLSDPRIVEAITQHFVGVAIYNNAGGRDRAALRSFSEPAWNNPVVRVMDARRRSLAARFAGPYTVRAFSGVLVAALRSAHRPVPAFLEQLAARGAARSRVTLAMHCFWEGEAKLGSIPGVKTTAAGFLGGREVVEVTFDPARIALATLVSQARMRGVASRVFVHQHAQLPAARAAAGAANVELTRRRMRPSPSDDKHYLAHSRWRSVVMTPEQATRANAAIAAGQAPAVAIPAAAAPSEAE